MQNSTQRKSLPRFRVGDDDAQETPKYGLGSLVMARKRLAILCNTGTPAAIMD